MNIISVSNHKGGVGKTTSTANIGAGLANKGKKVLLIDLDPQANLTQSLLQNDTDKNVYGALRGDYELPVEKIEKNLFLVPSHIDLANIEMELSSKLSRETFLKKLISNLKLKFDYILIDCPPSLGLITINAFVASDSVLIPLQAQFLSLQGLSKMTEFIAMVQESINNKLTVLGVFLTQFDTRKRLNKDISEAVSSIFEGKIFQTHIRDNVALAEAPISKQNIFDYNPTSNGARDYEALVLEILEAK